MRIAAVYDIHGNLPALEAVLDAIDLANVDQIVVGGDVVPGPMPRETLTRLRQIGRPIHFIQGNCERAVLARLAAGDTGEAAYWGTVSGKPLPPALQAGYHWTAQQVRPYADWIASWPKTLRLTIAGLGEVLFCHGTPRSETEVFTRLTAAARLRPVLAGLGAAVVVCGHTHMPFDRQVDATRIVNAGSVGEPFGAPGAHWVLLGPEVELRRTDYDLALAAERICATTYPQAQAVAQALLAPPAEAEMLALFSSVELAEG